MTAGTHFAAGKVFLKVPGPTHPIHGQPSDEPEDD